jgi:hypothetical protein
MRWSWSATVLLLAFGAGCVTWREIPVPEPPAPPNVVTDLSRVRLRNGQSAEFLTMVVATDSIFGVRNNLGRNRVSVSFDQVERIEVRKKDAVRTLGLFAVIGLVSAYTGITGYKLK